MSYRKILIALPMLAAFGYASAQQTLVESNMLKRALSISAENGMLTNGEALADGNDLTVATLKATEGNPSLIVKFAKPVNATSFNMVAGKSLDNLPKRMTVYGRNAESDSWSTLTTIRSMAFTLPYTNYVNQLSSKQYSQYRFEIEQTAGANMTVELAELQVLGLDADLNILSTTDCGSFSVDGYEGLGSAASVQKVNYDLGIMDETPWVSTIQYDFNEPTAIDGYTLGVATLGAKNNRPRAWELQGSEDGETWHTLDMQLNEPQLNGLNYALEYRFGKSGHTIDFGAAADNILSFATSKFYKSYGNGHYLLNSWSADASKINTGYNYWWMAHTCDAFIDAAVRVASVDERQSRRYESFANEIKTGMYTAYNPGRYDLWNEYNDDMEWMCLACIRGYYGFGKDKWLSEAKQLFDWIWESWDATTGGILWRTVSERGVLSSKNSCSNAPAMICANMLYEITGEQHYLDKAKMIYDFMIEHSLFDDGFVKDAPTNPNRGWCFTYNQGTWVGGLMGLYKATGDRKYYDIAVDLMDKSIDSRWYSPNGIMGESGKGDGGLFKGIYIRYLTEWVLSGFLDQERQMRYANYLLENARSLYLSALLKPEGIIMANWQSRSEANLEQYDSSVMLSGLFLLEGVDKMRRAGILNDDYSLNNPNCDVAYSHYRLRATANYGGANVEFANFALLGEQEDSSIRTVSAADSDLDDAWFTISGLKIAVPTASGVYIRRSGGKTQKILVK